MLIACRYTAGGEYLRQFSTDAATSPIGVAVEHDGDISTLLVKVRWSNSLLLAVLYLVNQSSMRAALLMGSV